VDRHFERFRSNKFGSNSITTVVYRCPLQLKVTAVVNDNTTTSSLRLDLQNANPSLDHQPSCSDLLEIQSCKVMILLLITSSAFNFCLLLHLLDQSCFFGFGKKLCLQTFHNIYYCRCRCNDLDVDMKIRSRFIEVVTDAMIIRGTLDKNKVQSLEPEMNKINSKQDKKKTAPH
jgi:hypothetical protein